MLLTDRLALVGSGEARLSDQYDCNVYAIDAPDGTILVDTGAGRDTKTLLENARQTVGDPDVALLTHAHADHSQGGPYLRELGVDIVAPSASVPLLTEGTDEELGITAAKRDDVYPGAYQYTHFEPSRLVEAGTSVSVAGLSFDVVRIRGHATDHVAYIVTLDERRCCFVGDAVYPDGSISLLNVPGSSLAAYREDIENLAGQDVDALLPGHGLPRLADGQESIELAREQLRGMFSPDSKT